MKQADVVVVLERLRVLRDRLPWLLETEKKLARLARAYIDLEKLVRGRKNRLNAFAERRSWLWLFDHVFGNNEMYRWLAEDAEQAQKLKAEIEREMEKTVKNHPVYTYYLKKQPGIGTTLAALLLGWMPPWRYRNPSTMIKCLGYSPASSEKHDRIGKTIVHKIAISMLRKHPNNLWRELYEHFLEHVKRTECSVKSCTKAHLHMKALRRVKRLFISHYYCAYAIILRCKYSLDLLPTTHYVATIHPPLNQLEKARVKAHSTYLPPCIPAKKGLWTPLEAIVCKQ